MARKELEVSFSPGDGPFDTPTWVDITARVRTAEWTWGRQRDDEDFQAGEATIVLDNHDRLFDPDNTSGTYTGQLLPRVPFRLRTNAGEDLFYGFVEDGWEQTYQHPADGYCTVRLVDLLAVLEGYELTSVLQAEIIADNPVAYWPLDETSGDAMRDASGNFGDGVYVDGTTGLSRSVETLDGLPVRGLDLDGEHWGQIHDLATVVSTRPCCIELVFQPSNPTSSGIIFRSGTGNADLGATVQFDGGGGSADTWGITSATRDGEANGLVTTGDYSARGAEGGMHHYTHQRPSTGDAVAWLDGVDVTDTVLTVPSNRIAVAPGTVIGSADYQFNPGTGGGTPNAAHVGFVAHVAIYDTDLGSTRIAAHADAALNPLGGLRSDEQVGWVLDQVGVPAGSRNLDTGRAAMPPANTAGETALKFIRKVARTEQGGFYVDHTDGGKLRFVERYAPWFATRSTASQATFSDDPTDTTAVRVEPGTLIVEANGIRTVVNQAAVKWAGGTETAEDATSVAAYGPRGRTIDALAVSPYQARGLAQWVSRMQAEPVTRVRGFGLNPAGAEDAFPTAVDLRPFDLVTFRSQPGQTGSVTTRNLLIQGVTHRVSQGLGWTSTFFTAGTPADLLDLFILGTSELDGTDVLAY